MTKWHDYDPNTGLHEINVSDDASDILTVHKYQDLTALLDRNAELRNTGATDGGIRKGLWHYASVPIGIQYELLAKYGLNFHNKNHTSRIFDVINRDYPLLKTTNKHHSIKHST